MEEHIKTIGKFICENPTAISETDGKGNTILHLAIQSKNTNKVQALLAGIRQARRDDTTKTVRDNFDVEKKIKKARQELLWIWHWQMAITILPQLLFIIVPQK